MRLLGRLGVHGFATSISLLAAVTAFGLGIRYGTFAAADTDPYGYVSQAELIGGGRLRVDQRYVLSMPWRDAEESFIPAGYKRAPVAGYIVPTYPVGLPLVMAGLLRMTNHRDAVFFAVPLLGALMVWATARVGARLYGPWIGAAAAVLLVTSPIFVLQVIQPVSDVPAAAWWTLAVLLVLRQTRWSALGAGLAASMAILTRPNLVPLAAVLGVFYLGRALRGTAPGRRDAVVQLAGFCVATLPGCLAVAALNNYLYGSPLSSGYAPFHELYQWKHVPFNLDRYPRWLMQTETPLIYLGVLAPFLARERARAWLLWAFAAAVVLSYIPYGYFGYGEWGYLRFLLPAYPMLFILSLFVGGELLGRTLRNRAAFAAVAVATLVAVVGWSAWQVHQASLLYFHEIESRYVTAGHYAAVAMPREAVYIAALHAGSLRYYAGQPTINFNTLDPHALDDAVNALVAMGRKPYIVIEDGEEPQFRWRFDTYSDLGKLDWPPSVQTRRGAVVRIYNPAERARYMSGQPVATFNMEFTGKPIITQK